VASAASHAVGDEPKHHVVVTWPDYDADGEQLGGALARAGLGVRLAPKLGARSAPEVRALVQGAVGAIVSTDPFDAGVLAGSPALRVIARVGVGVDSIDLEAATAHGVAVTVTPGVNEGTVADHTIALMLAAARRICEQDAAVRRGEWDRTGEHVASLLSAGTVGLIGFGHVGRLVAERLRGFQVRVLVNDPIAPDDESVEAVGLDALLAACDVVSLHVPLLASTRGLIGARELALMRPDAILVNTARGGVVDEAALVDALECGRLRAAALDVFADEPPAGSRLLALRNVVLSPHIAGLSSRSVQEMTLRATRSVIDVLSGRPPLHVANPEVLDHAAFAAAQLGIRGQHA
jgi:D-3-phosphoglycerate dehydrogenase / 2-oxoglutarate reductase